MVLGYVSGTWQCRLYGHNWHHPWNHEVVVTSETSVYPLRCLHCAETQLLDSDGNNWHPADEDGPSIHEQALEFDPKTDASRHR
ncbi:uncharacterized protein Nmag_3811 (plasmid) [Natrialba magadii ATCC 43099]|uniref:Uncharacterized protein n=1 Tax=Natrialba magadii (strain ATCC 43099 / DSM 3394 / CCM 3739 / CIP 104546 / IAM 13178 / JCM 8861 / NBRC 102185 / NCIMB 2190 / MS3) TaxID=547559 RepID=D3T193_NATMM|nr:hypothetical protein [Natrialba magadii]ADD07352.1 uncharacterized protein Nmag_3811 [Natrialba magadii ATCC 43099]ELY32607.1 hypothetical protein C500_03764 [Natrialba magadii ATCC 43099]